MEFRELSIRGFLSYRDKQTFFFDRPPGLYLITGNNEVDIELQANGVGKSVISDALKAVMYGDTVRGLKGAKQLTNWHSDSGCRLELLVDDHEIIRSWNPNRFIIDGKTPAQAAANELYGLDDRAFLYSVILGQDQDTFMDLRPQEKIELFESVVDLGCWDRCGEIAKDYESQMVGFLNDANSQKSFLKGKVEQLEQVIASIRDKKSEWAEKQKDLVSELEQELSDTVYELDKLIEKLKVLQEENKVYTKTIDSNINKINKLETEMAVLESTMIELKSDIRENRRRVQDQKDAFSDLISMDRCVTCHQSITKEHLKQEEQVTSEFCSGLLREVEEWSVEHDKANAKYLSLRSTVTLLSEEISDLKRELRDEEIADLNTSIASRRQVVSNLKDQIKQKRGERNPHTTDEEVEELKGIKSDLADRNKLIVELEAEKISSAYWVKGFRNLKLIMITNILDHLAMEVNNILHRLGLPDWHVKFDIEAVTTSKTVKFGFVVLVCTPQQQESVPWSTWSGGEKQRIRLAGWLGLSRLIESIKGVHSNVMILDEVTRGLSEVDSLLTCLKQYALDTKKAIYVTEHTSLPYAQWDDIITITKKEKGSVING